VFSGYEDAFSGLKRTERDVDHFPSSSAEINKEWIHTSALLIFFHGVYRETFTFTIQTTLGAVKYGLHHF
jgi:hypothetical protein